MFYNIDAILTHFSFSKPTEILETCISMDSWCHQHASIYGACWWHTQIAWLKLHNIAGYVVKVFLIHIIKEAARGNNEGV